MATKTLGTNANNSLTALSFVPGIGGMVAADQASIANGIKNDLNPTKPIVGGSFSSNGILYVPNRGELIILPGDVVAIDSQGWPVLVSLNSVTNGPWTFA